MDFQNYKLQNIPKFLRYIFFTFVNIILMKKKIIVYVLGFITGVVSSLLGAGGGMISVPSLKKAGLETKDAHANAVAVILPIALLSSVLYLLDGRMTFGDALPFLPGGLIGAILGTLILKKISPLWLNRIFGGFMVYLGVRMFL